ncbi:MAG: WG repeat-containing protein, partial [Cyclobacteriaceae bacterium]
LINLAGEVVLPPVYEQIGWSDGTAKVTDGVIGFRKNGFWGILSEKGKEITSPLYKSLTFSDGRYLIASTPGKFSRTPLYGLLDKKGRVITSFRYNRITYTTDGQYIVSELLNGRQQKGVLIPDGKPILDIIYKDVKYLNSGQYLIRTFAGYQGIASPEGNEVIPAIYETICLTETNQFRVSKDGFTGEISRLGKILTPVSAKSVSDNRLVKFPVWTIRNPKNEIEKTIMADSLRSVGEDRLLIYRNSRSFLYTDELAKSGVFEGMAILETLEDAVIVRTDKGVEVKNSDGSTRISQVFDSIYFDKNYFYAKMPGSGGWKLYSRVGTLLSKASVDRILPATEDRIRFKKRGFWGVLDFDGSVLVNPKYDTILPFIDKKAIVQKLDLWGVLDDQNQWVIFPYENSLRRLNSSLFVAKKGYHIRFYNMKGQPVRSITTGFRMLDEYIVVGGDYDKEGLMDEYGRMIIPVAYDTIIRLADSRFFNVSIDSLSGIIDASDRVILPLSERLGDVPGYSEDMIGVQLDGKYGFVNTIGQLLIANRYDKVRLFSDGLAAYRLNNKWGFLNKKEKLVIQPVYTEILSFKEGVTAVRDKEKWGLIDKTGKVIEGFRYHNIERLPDGKYLLYGDKGIGLNDKNGESIFQPVYQNLQDLGNGSAIVEKNGKWGVISYNGAYIIPTLYEEIKYETLRNRFFVRE